MLTGVAVAIMVVGALSWFPPHILSAGARAASACVQTGPARSGYHPWCPRRHLIQLVVTRSAGPTQRRNRFSEGKHAKKFRFPSEKPLTSDFRVCILRAVTLEKQYFQSGGRRKIARGSMADAVTARSLRRTKGGFAALCNPCITSCNQPKFDQEVFQWQQQRKQPRNPWP